MPLLRAEDASVMGPLELPIETERLVLRRFKPEDLDAVAIYQSLPEIQRYFDWKVRDRAECKSVLDIMCSQKSLQRPGDSVALAVVKADDDTVIGQACVKWTDATASQAELRFAMNPAYRKQGFCSEMIKAMLDLGFDHFNFHRIFVRCSGKSHSTARLLKSIGFRLEAHYREHALFQGEWDEELHFAILDREWHRGTKVKELSAHMVA
jgi:RimJ/RimL family protein N-acetyltransferase